MPNMNKNLLSTPQIIRSGKVSSGIRQREPEYHTQGLKPSGGGAESRGWTLWLRTPQRSVNANDFCRQRGSTRIDGPCSD